MDDQSLVLEEGFAIPAELPGGDGAVEEYVYKAGGALPEACADCFLQQHCLTSKLDSQSRQAVAEVTDHPRPLQKGEHLYRQSDAFAHLYIVRSGAIKAYSLDEDGEERIAGFYFPGETLGIDGVAATGHRLSAQALDTTSVCRIDFRAFEALFTRHPAILRHFTYLLCDEIYQRQQPLLALLQLPAEERLVAFLLDLVQRLTLHNRTEDAFSLPMSRRDIARYLCLAEETLSRAFRRLQERDLLKMRGRKVTGFDQQRLLAMGVAPASVHGRVH